MTRRRVTLLAAAAITTAVLVSGCGGSVPGPSGTESGTAMMTPFEARDAFAVLTDRIQVEVGGKWRLENPRSPGSCEVSDGEGVFFRTLRLGSSPGTMEDAKIVIDRVTLLLQAEGYKVLESVFTGEGGYDLTMINAADSSINFGANDIAMTMSGKSDCVAGDLGKIIDEFNTEYLKQQTSNPTSTPTSTP